MKGTVISKGEITGAFDNYNAPAELTDDEKTAIDYIKAVFDDNSVDFSQIKFCRRSNNYLSLITSNNMDFCRIKVGKRSCWFSIHGLQLPDDIKQDKRFESVNKKLVHWKVLLSDVSDFKSNSDLILESYLSVK